MNSGKPFLDNLFDGLSSIYRKDNGMLNSELFVLLNAYGQVLDDSQRELDKIANNTYISSADEDALEDNFGDLINFPKPPRLNTISDGNEIYRAMLQSMFSTFLSGATNATMEQALNTNLSLLTTDPSSDQAVSVDNFAKFDIGTEKIQLTWDAVRPSGNNNQFVDGPARAEDIVFSPQDLIVTSYNSENRFIQFTGTLNTGTNYRISYRRDNQNFEDTNWLNLTDRSQTNVSPLALTDGRIDTFNNPQFSYWWNTFNVDGSGVVIDEFKINRDESSLVWRLPQKTASYISPFTDGVVNQSYPFYNISGTVFDLSVVNTLNPDIKFSNFPLNYQEDVSARFSNYFVRYSNNNQTFTAFDEFQGTFTKFVKRQQSIDFPSSDFGRLDFFEKGADFDPDDLFGSGTKHVWLDVLHDPSTTAYIINNANFFERKLSLHDLCLYQENFEEGHLRKISNAVGGIQRITDLVGAPKSDKEDCLMYLANGSGTITSSAPILSPAQYGRANRIKLDIFDALNSGTQTYVDITRTGTSGEFHRFRFGIDDNFTPQEVINNAAVLVKTQDFGFIRTFFANSASTVNAINAADAANFFTPGNTVNSSYEFVDGNINNFSKSQLSIKPTGLGVVFITPNGTPNLINNSDKFKIEFTDNGNSKVSIKFTYFGPTGFGPGKRTYELSYDSGVGDVFWKWRRIRRRKTSIFSPFSTQVLGGNTNIPVTTGNNIFEISNFKNMTLNGIIYTGSQIDPSSQAIFGNLGTAVAGGGPNVFSASEINSGDPDSVLLNVTTSPARNPIILHAYTFGNSSSEANFDANQQVIGGGATTVIVDPRLLLTPYFYQNFTSPNESSIKHYLPQFPRDFQWRTLTVDFGINYDNLIATLDEAEFLNTTVGFSGNLISPSGVTMSHVTDFPEHEFSYFDNIKISYFDHNNFIPIYDTRVAPFPEEDWEGSALNHSIVVDNKFFEDEIVSNFQFNVKIVGLDENFIFIINQIIERLKPAHTIVVPIFEQTQSLDTTEQVPAVANTGTDWETGSVLKNIAIKSDGATNPPATDKQGYITVSGLN